MLLFHLKVTFSTNSFAKTRNTRNIVDNSRSSSSLFEKCRVFFTWTEKFRNTFRATDSNLINASDITRIEVGRELILEMTVSISTTQKYNARGGETRFYPFRDGFSGGVDAKVRCVSLSNLRKLCNKSTAPLWSPKCLYTTSTAATARELTRYTFGISNYNFTDASSVEKISRKSPIGKT